MAALHHGRKRLDEGFPLSNRLVREIHAELQPTGRGDSMMPGQFRRSRNWIGGGGPDSAAFAPPPHTAVPGCMSALERFLHAGDDGIPALLRAGLAHVQFETIHPFLDGNGRVGRALIELILCDAGVLHHPVLCRSLYFRQARSVYYRLLNSVRITGDWETWLIFFLSGVEQTAEAGVSTALQLLRLFKEDAGKIKSVAGRRAGSATRLLRALRVTPITSLPLARERTGLSYRGTSSAMQVLVEHGIAREITNRHRNRLFAYQACLDILNEETEMR